jgi:hypothetical protein
MLATLTEKKYRSFCGAISCCFCCLSLDAIHPKDSTNICANIGDTWPAISNH